MIHSFIHSFILFLSHVCMCVYVFIYLFIYFTPYIICSKTRSTSATPVERGQKLKKALCGIFSNLLKLTNLKANETKDNIYKKTCSISRLTVTKRKRTHWISKIKAFSRQNWNKNKIKYIWSYKHWHKSLEQPSLWPVCNVWVLCLLTPENPILNSKTVVKTADF